MGIMSTSISGLQIAQLGIQTADHNIANAKTPGFNRQRTIQASNAAMATGAGYIGQGARVTTVERIYDSFLYAQVTRAQTSSSELSTYYAQIKQIDNMLADANAGVSSALQDFFSGVSTVAANPSQVPGRQSMVSSAQALASRFQTVDDRISQLYEGVDSQITTAVTTINSYSTQIAKLNESIVLATASTNQPPNDLLDQRDQLVLEMNKFVKVSTTTNNDGSFNVYFGNGQQLVVSLQAKMMTAQPSVADPTRLAIGLQTASGSLELPESYVSGGSLGGLLSFRSVSLDRVSNDLGRNAASLALTFNAQNALGQDLLGNVAGDANFQAKFFNVPTPQVVASTLNKVSSPDVFVSYTTPPPFNGNFYTDLTGSDYRLNVGATTLTLTRLSDNKQWPQSPAVATTVAALNGLLAADPQGFSLDPAVFNLATDAGASYLIEPTRGAASNISVNSAIAFDPRLVAAAAPIRTAAGTINATTGAITNANKGTASISAGSVGTGYQAVIPGVFPAVAPGVPLTLTFNSNTTPASAPAVPNLTGFPVGSTVRVTNGTTVTDYPSLTAASFVPFTSGATISLMTGPNPVTDSIALSVAISGTPVNGDSFSIGRNLAATTDGRNALVLGQLQTQNTMSGKTASYQSAYSQMVSVVGNKTREMEVKGKAQDALLKQSENARSSLSGVNLDEEAANLMRFQQAYKASAQAMSVANTLFDTVLAIRS
jgi:flagellar hook-associated protein 1 FlgK